MTLQALFITVLIGCLPTLALAEQASEENDCIQVEVNGFKTLSFECLNKQLSNPNAQEAARKNYEQMNSPIYKQAPNRLGLFNQSATRTRMGNTFGSSVHAQRPSTGN